MYSKKTTVINRTGLHARPASQFIEMAKRFSSRIQISNLSLDDEDNIANRLFPFLRSEWGRAARSKFLPLARTNRRRLIL